jgi:hypothetical protein
MVSRLYKQMEMLGLDDPAPDLSKITTNKGPNKDPI